MASDGVDAAPGRLSQLRRASGSHPGSRSPDPLRPSPPELRHSTSWSMEKWSLSGAGLKLSTPDWTALRTPAARNRGTNRRLARARHEKSHRDLTIGQSTGGATELGHANLIDPRHPTHRVLVYRLVSLPDDTNPWGAGLLLTAAEEHADDDDALRRAVKELLRRPWEEDGDESAAPAPAPAADGAPSAAQRDRWTSVLSSAARLSRADSAAVTPARRTWTCAQCRASAAERSRGSASSKDRLEGSEAHSGASWGYVLQHGRGTVGETALHLCFLLNTEHHRRLIRILVPQLAKLTTTEPVLKPAPSAGAAAEGRPARASRRLSAAFEHREVSCLDAAYIGQPYHGEVGAPNRPFSRLLAPSMTCCRLLLTRRSACTSPSCTETWAWSSSSSSTAPTRPRRTHRVCPLHK